MIQFKDPYSLDYEQPLDLREYPDKIVSPEADKLDISPLGVILEQRLTVYKDKIRDWCVENRLLVVVVCLIVVYALIWTLRSK